MLKKKIKWLSMTVCVLFISSVFSVTIDNTGDFEENGLTIKYAQVERNISAIIAYKNTNYMISNTLQPEVVITSPEDESVFTEPEITLTGYAVDELGINYIDYVWEWEGGGTGPSWPIDPPVEYLEFEWGFVLYEGWNHIKVTAGNVNGVYGSDEITVYYNPEGDTEPPIVVIEYPEDGSTFTEPEITITGYASDNVGVTTLGVHHEWEGGEESTSGTVDPPSTYISFEIMNLELRLNWNRITVFATDEAGNEGSETVMCAYNRTDCSLKLEVKGKKPYVGFKKYDTPYKGKVFRRGSKETIPRFEATIKGTVPEGAECVIDIYKGEKKVRRLKKEPHLHIITSKKFEGKWNDWKSDTNLWKKYDKIPIGKYQAQAKILNVINGEGGEVCHSDKMDFWVIFDKPKSLGEAEERAYLYDNNPSGNDAKAIHYNGYDNPEWFNRERRHIKWMERVRTLNQFREFFFEIVISAVDGETSESATAEKLMHAVSNVIFYKRPYNQGRSVYEMFKNKVKKKENFLDAFKGKEQQLIKGHCHDYAHSLTAMFRSIGIPARVATNIQNGGFKYHEWTEAYLEHPPKGKDKWYVYDAMDYTNPPHTPKDDVSRSAAGSAPRKNAPYDDTAYEIPVGKPEWKYDRGHLKLKIVDKKTQSGYIRRQDNTDDASFEKCEEKKYNSASCVNPKFLCCTTVNPSFNTININLSFNKEEYRVTEPIIANVRINNTNATTITADLNVTIYKIYSGEDGRDAFGDPVLNTTGSGVIGEVVGKITDQITIPSNQYIDKKYTFSIDDTTYPIYEYIAEAVLFNTSTGLFEGDSYKFDLLPAYEGKTIIPQVFPNDSLTVTLDITNKLGFSINDIEVRFEHPDHYSTTDSLNQSLSILNPNESQFLTWYLIPEETSDDSEAEFVFNITSSNGGNHILIVYHKIMRPPKLEIQSTISKFLHNQEEPFTSGIKEIRFSIQNIGDLTATDIYVVLSLPENVTADNTNWHFSTLKEGAKIELNTNITTYTNKSFEIDIFAYCDEDNDTAVVPVMFEYVLPWMDTFEDDHYIDMTASENIKIINGKIKLVSSAKNGVAYSMPIDVETDFWQQFSWNEVLDSYQIISNSYTTMSNSYTIMSVSDDFENWTEIENGGDISFLDYTAPIYWKYEMFINETSQPLLGIELHDIEILYTKKGLIEDSSSPLVDIIKPEKAIYINNKKILPFFTTIIIGDIDIEVQASDDVSGIFSVEFYVNDEWKATDIIEPYRSTWDERAFGRRNLLVMAYDYAGNKATDKQEVWIFNL